jgi:cytochrome c553
VSIGSRLRAAAWLACILLPGLAQAQDADAGKAKAATCMACHGADGNSPTAVIPNLAGQTARYIYLELRDFKSGQRQNPIMQPLAQTLSKEDMLDLGAFFAAQALRDNGFKADPAKVARGQGKENENLCTMCHLGAMKGQNEVPRVAGQHHDYVVKQLQDFKSGARTNDAGTMSSVAKSLSDQDMDDLAHLMETLN